MFGTERINNTLAQFPYLVPTLVLTQQVCQFTVLQFKMFSEMQILVSKHGSHIDWSTCKYESIFQSGNFAQNTGKVGEF